MVRVCAVLLVMALAVSVPALVNAGKPRKLVVGKGNLVAPLRIPAKPRSGPVPSCRKPTLKCIRNEIARLKAAEERLGCDHRAVFATTYRVLTQFAFRTVRDDPGFLRFPRWFFFEDGLFADVYLATMRADAEGRRVSPAWQIAFDTAADGNVGGVQDMLLGINAHVQNDFPFVIAALSTNTKNGTSRKPDHDKFNVVLEKAYQAVVDEVERRYDPLIAVSNPDGVPADDVAGAELVRQWREQVWANAEKLIATRKDPAAHAEVVQAIESNAADWARTISAQQIPGYRAQRDSYCEAQRG